MSVDPSPEFDSVAGNYDALLNRSLSASGEQKEYFLEGRLRWLSDFLHSKGVQACGHVIDFGCGTGSATRALQRYWQPGVLEGVDVSGASLEVARSLHQDMPVRFGTPAQAGEGMADLVYCNGVFHHIPPDERKQSLSLVFRFLKPGGYFAFFENNPWNPGTVWIMSRCEFDRTAKTINPFKARRMLEDAGFEIVVLRSLFYFPRFLSALRLLEKPLSRLPLGGQYVVLGRKPV